MNYSDFVSDVKGKILDYMPEGYASSDVSLTTVTKANGVVNDALIIRKEGSNGGPACYLNELFTEYEKNSDFEKFMTSLAKSIDEQYKMAEKGLDVNDFAKLENVKDNVFAEVISRESNEEYLENKPFTEVADLAVIYRVRVDDDKSFIINNDIAALYGVDANDLYDIAAENAKMENSYSITGMSEKISQMGFGMEESFDGKEDMYILSNRTGLYGAGCIAFTDVMDKAMEVIGEPFYILPSSLHELIAVPASRFDDVKALEDMVRDVNESVVESHDKLSDNVYVYNESSRSIEICNSVIDLEPGRDIESSLSH